jgi:hypothetical protein
MAGHVYTVSMSDTTIVADSTLVIIHAAAAVATRGSILEILRAECGQRSSDTSDQLGVVLAQKVTAFGTYTSATPSPHQVGGAASGIAGGTAGAAATAGVDASAEGAGAVTNIIPVPFNNLNGWLWVPTPEERFIVGPDIAVILKLIGTPSNLANWFAYVTFQEIN